MATKINPNASAEEKREHFRQMAQAHMEKHKCRWSEATLAIKKKYPEARAVFGAPAK